MSAYLEQKGKRVKAAAAALATIGQDDKNRALLAIADGLVQNGAYLLEQNKIDLSLAKDKGVADAMLDRLALSEARIAGMAEGIRQVAALPDPIGAVDGMVKRPNGLLIGKVRVPLGVIGIIYESRPNVTADAAALCVKAGNAVILRGGSEAIYSNIAIAKVMNEAGQCAGLPDGAIELVDDPSREIATELMRLNKYVNVLIPRGGAGLIRSVVQNATVPVIETGTGNCHIYVEKTADFDMARDITVNAKVSRPSVCNAAESLLVDAEIAGTFLPGVLDALAEAGVELRGCERTRAIYPSAKSASEEDFYTEYNDYIISVKVVDGLGQAITHINEYGTGHSEAIVTRNYAASQRFLAEVDAAAVYVNASTRFTDGFEFGLGAEIGISTQKMHARGPMGLHELTTIKYVIYGNGQVR
ncbi:gamma-glutamyl phosphate reductase [Clostridia bacterium]|nr:gamma-glutamyl phosphate reductase [Clostridia bacterium]